MTRQSLGVPDWFICDGCSHSPDSKWLTPPCNKHDWDYWRGSTEQEAEDSRSQADRELRANIKQSAQETPGSWFDRLWRPVVGEVYYFAVTRFGERSWRIRESQPEDWRELARIEMKYDPRGDAT